MEKEKLYKRIIREMKKVLDLEYDPSGEKYNSLWVTNVENDILDECLQKLHKNKEKGLPDFELIVIDADNIANGLFPQNLPIVGTNLMYRPDEDVPALSMEELKYGILYIRNITEENNERFPFNFTYNLSKNHSIDKYLLNPHFLIVCGIPNYNFHLDVQGIFSHVDKSEL